MAWYMRVSKHLPTLDLWKTFALKGFIAMSLGAFTFSKPDLDMYNVCILLEKRRAFLAHVCIWFGANSLDVNVGTRVPLSLERLHFFPRKFCQLSPLGCWSQLCDLHFQRIWILQILEYFNIKEKALSNFAFQSF